MRFLRWLFRRPRRVVAMELTLKSGTTLTVDATRIKWSSEGLEWTTPAWARRRLCRACLDDIVAVVAVLR